ncbi:hypothetical protein GCM10010121_074770 [Streptomyces brasiliensis]|uniref:Uncharacterized protein n=1 Tax=Streptomyces brasiliensis TaxID=1954 RepID=A0A917LAZ5_9ACTN|nr:hypothetical protein GCM10010121_074770 [Streptomyces brasiliensis]
MVEFVCWAVEPPESTLPAYGSERVAKSHRSTVRQRCGVRYDGSNRPGQRSRGACALVRFFGSGSLGERGVVDVTTLVAAVERVVVAFVQGSAEAEAFGKVRVGNERAAERDEVGLAGGEGLLGGLPGELTVGDDRAGERRT